MAATSNNVYPLPDGSGNEASRIVGQDKVPTTITATAGKDLKTVYVNNKSAQAVSVKFFDDAAPTVGTDSPEFKIPVAANSSQMAVLSDMDFATAITVAVVQEAADTGTTDPTADVDITSTFGD